MNDFSLKSSAPHNPDKTPRDSDAEELLPPRTGWSTVSQLDRKPFWVKRFEPPHAPTPEVALLVSTYQKPWHLTRTLQSIAQQNGGPFEVVITDDGSKDQTHQIIEDFAQSVDFPVAITTHPHVGFELSRCRNEGVLASNAPYLLFLDGDCVLPPDHVAIHLQRRREHRVMVGFYAKLDKMTSERFDEASIRTAQYLEWIPRKEIKALAKLYRKDCFYSLIRHPNKPRLTGCDCGMWRNDFLSINGYDENFRGWGGEDNDLGLRLRRQGLRMESIVKWTHTYHLWHPVHTTTPKKIRDGANQPYMNRHVKFTQCLNGLARRHLEQETLALAGQADRPEEMEAFLKRAGLSATIQETNESRLHKDIELLFLPGKGTFSNRADCNILVVLEDCPQAKRLAKHAQILISDTHYRPVPQEWTFPLADAPNAIKTLLQDGLSS